MPKKKRLQTGVDWFELSTTPADWQSADPPLLGSMLSQLHLIRAFEEAVLELAGEGLVHGPAHSSIGQEGGAVGSIIGLRSTDGVNGSHRGHHQFLAKALTHVSGGRIDPAEPLTPEIRTILQRTLAEILGLAQGFCRGRGGSMHLQWFEAGALGTNAIVGGGAPMATGNAWAQKHSGTSDITINYFGDGAAQIGSVLESMNLAGAWALPVCFFIENNLYAVSTRADEITADPRFSVRGQGFGIPSWRVDGMDPLAVHLAMQEAEERMRSGAGPTVVEAEVYRFFHQNGPYPGSAFGYRTKEEEAAWRARDPLDLVARKMIERGLVDPDGITVLRDQSKEAMAEAVDQLLEPDPDSPGKRRIRPHLWPERSFVNVGIRGDGSELARAAAARSRSREATSEVHRRGGPGHGSADGPRRPHRRDGRGCASSQRRHQRCHQGPRQALRERTCARHTDQRERLRRPRRWSGPRWSVPAGGRVHVPRLHVGGRGPGVQPDRQGAAHVRGRQPCACGVADQGRHGFRLRLPAPHGSRWRLRHEPGLANRGAVERR